MTVLYDIDILHRLFEVNLSISFVIKACRLWRWSFLFDVASMNAVLLTFKVNMLAVVQSLMSFIYECIE